MIISLGVVSKSETFHGDCLKCESFLGCGIENETVPGIVSKVKPSLRVVLKLKPFPGVVSKSETIPELNPAEFWQNPTQELASGCTFRGGIGTYRHTVVT